MKAYHHLNKREQSPPLHYDPYQLSGTTKSQDISRKALEDNSDIRLRAYQIHLEKGGSDLDNWLDAERSLKNVK